MKILVPQMLQNRFGERKTSEVRNELDVEIGRLLGLKAGQFRAHWLDDFDYQYSIVGVLNRKVVAYAQFDFRGFDPPKGTFEGFIGHLASRGLSDGEMDQFFLKSVKRYTSLVHQLSAMNPAAIDRRCEMPWITLRAGQRRWKKLVMKHGWSTIEPAGVYIEDDPALCAEVVMVLYEPPQEYIVD